MKLLKKDLVRALAQAAQFNQLSLTYVGTSKAYRGAVELIRSRGNFVPVCQYGRGMLPLQGEFGTNGKTRYIFRAGAGASK